MASPNPSRPHMPGYETMFKKGKRSLPWTWAEGVLSKSRNYWLATTRTDGRPHVMPLWGVWIDGNFCFSTGPQSRKSRNLAANNYCVVCPEGAREAVILEGKAREFKNSALLQRFIRDYWKKYKWKFKKTDGPFYAVQPIVAFGFIERPRRVSGNPTRWLFSRRQ